LTSCKPISFSRRTLYHGVSKYLPLFRLKTVPRFKSSSKLFSLFLHEFVSVTVFVETPLTTGIRISIPPHSATATSRPGPPHYPGFTITFGYTKPNPAGRFISPTQRPLPDNTQNSQETDIHVPYGIRTRNPSKASGRRPTL
jgi:hypothetical protein